MLSFRGPFSGRLECELGQFDFKTTALAQQPWKKSRHLQTERALNSGEASSACLPRSSPEERMRQIYFPPIKNSGIEFEAISPTGQGNKIWTKKDAEKLKRI